MVYFHSPDKHSIVSSNTEKVVGVNSGVQYGAELP